MKTLIIAEAGVNHNGSLARAQALVAQAAAAGADLVKFQSFITAKSISPQAPKAAYQLGATDPGESQYDMVRKLGATKIQGFYFGRPMVPEEANKLFYQTIARRGGEAA